jgi:phage baseplate assembly protein W
MTVDINSSISRIILTPIGSRVLNPAFGSRINELIDKPNGEGLKADASRFAYESLKLEPRINVERIGFAGEKLTIAYESETDNTIAEITI